MTEAFTWTTAAMFAGVAAGSIASGTLVDTAGVGAPFLAASLAVALAGAIAARRGAEAARRGVRRAVPVLGRD
jgi:hypothetical protein